QKHGDKVDDVEIGIDRWAGTFRTIPMYASSATEHDLTSGILGENYLKNFIVTIDFGRMRLDLVPVARIPNESSDELLGLEGRNQIPR
ncbi:MAG: hypothetical protein ACRD3J_08870, partial [Thermoanaerobaculia bacterium]